MVDFNNVRLGRRPHDTARVAAVPQHFAVGAPAPLALPRNDITWVPTLAKNNILPTCTIAGLMNSARMWALLHGFDLTQVEASLLSFFSKMAGCADNDAARAATDGLVVLDVLENALSGGFDTGAQTALVPRFKAIDITSAAAIRDAIFTVGTAYIGVLLHESDVQPGASWTGGTAAAGSVVGGHCIAAWSYGVDTFGLATWGETIEADEAWLMSRIEEAYALSWTFPVVA